MTLPRQGGRDPSRPGACHRGHGCVPTGKPTQNILRANAPHTYRTRRTYTTHTLSCRLVGARAGLAPRRQAKWRGIRMNDSPLACLKGEPERAAPARARLCRPLRRPTAVGVGVGLARTSSNDSGRSEARERRSRAGHGRVAHGPRAQVGPGRAAAAPGPGTQTVTNQWHLSGSRRIRVGLEPVTVSHARSGHATVAAPALSDRRARARTRRIRVRHPAGADPPRLSRSRHGRGPVASRPGS